MDSPDSMATACGTGYTGAVPPGRLALFATGPRTPSERRRAIRVWLLVATIAILSMADLYMTLAHLQSAGMGEANPLARLVISYNSPLLLSVWKVACVFLACLILVMARYRWSGEAACWTCCAVLTGLTLHWAAYSTEASAYTRQIAAMHEEMPSNWVSMDGD